MLSKCVERPANVPWWSHPVSQLFVRPVRGAATCTGGDEKVHVVSQRHWDHEDSWEIWVSFMVEPKVQRIKGLCVYCFWGISPIFSHFPMVFPWKPPFMARTWQICGDKGYWFGVVWDWYDCSMIPSVSYSRLSIFQQCVKVDGLQICRQVRLTDDRSGWNIVPDAISENPRFNVGSLQQWIRTEPTKKLECQPTILVDTGVFSFMFFAKDTQHEDSGRDFHSSLGALPSPRPSPRGFQAGQAILVR